MSRLSLWVSYPFWSRMLAWILLPLALGCGALWLALQGSLPRLSGELHLSGPSAPITIERDANSVPAIAAANAHDAYFALGFVHAQDRLWQMEMNRRLSAGRLGEILGTSSVQSDIAMRRLGLYANARKIWRSLDADNRRILQVYVDGVNAGAAQLRMRPVEFHLLRVPREPWRPEDSLALMQLLNFQLSSNLGAEIRRLSLLQQAGATLAEELMPGTAAALKAVDVARPEADSLQAQRLAASAYVRNQEYIGSNSWVVSGKHTASGLPILANDPHLGMPIPSDWYLARLHGGPLQASGATLPGLPFVVIGRNDHIAWGITNMKADTQDIVLEEINPYNRNQYRDGDHYRDMEVHHERIDIKGDFLRPRPDPETVAIRRTKNGPVISDSWDQIDKHAFSLRWTADDDLGGTFNSFVKINYATNWNEFNKALSTYVTPIHNFVYADEAGNIGSVAPGLYPIRRSGNGSLPIRGGSAVALWQGWVPFAAVPRAFNPPQGYLVAANNRIVPPEYPYHITNDWSPDFRASRISAVLDGLIAAGRPIDPRRMQALQADVLAPAARNGILAHLLQTEPANAGQREALVLLRGWDGRMTADSAAATLFAAWYGQLNALVMERVLAPAPGGAAPRELLAAWTTSDNQAFLARMLTGKDRRWCERLDEGNGGDCRSMMRLALERALTELHKTLAGDPAEWRWGRLHRSAYTHFPFSRPRLSPGMPQVEEGFFSGLFDRDVGVGGGNDTVNLASVSFDKDSKYRQFSGPMYRQVIDMGNAHNDSFIVGTGQSGNPVSAHYDDLIAPHLDGVYLPMQASRPAAALRLLPVTRSR